MSAPLQGTQSAALAIGRVRYTHDAMIDMLIANPVISQGELAAAFGYTQAWVSRVLNSDAFQMRLAERKADLVDPTIAATIEEKLKAVASRSLDVVLDKLQAAPSADYSLKVLEVSAKALGYGARQANLNVQQNFVVALPSKAENTTQWLDSRSQQQGAGVVIEAPAAEVVNG
jgi:hypothetical protein